MFKQGDSVVISRLESTRRQRDVKKDGVGNQWIDSKPVLVKTKAVIGSLHRFFIPVVLPDGSTLRKPYSDLAFLKNGKVSWKTKKADHVKTVDHKETIVKGKEYIARGVISPSFRTQHIPVILNGEGVDIPLNQLVFKEKK